MPPPAVRKITDTLWELPVSYREGMRVPARIHATESLLQGMDQGVFDQVSNVVCLPGIVVHALCMPDGHWGYGFPIGGTAAFDPEDGIISPGGIGFDINCRTPLIGTGLTEEEVRPKLRELLRDGARWVLRRGYTVREDGLSDPDAAAVMGIAEPGQVVVMIHCGSRGFGHQVASDYLKSFIGLMTAKWKLPVRDRELACAPFASEEGRRYKDIEEAVRAAEDTGLSRRVARLVPIGTIKG